MDSSTVLFAEQSPTIKLGALTDYVDEAGFIITEDTDLVSEFVVKGNFSVEGTKPAGKYCCRIE